MSLLSSFTFPPPVDSMTNTDLINSINLEYMDPRPTSRQREDQASFAAESSQRREREANWQLNADKAATAGVAGPISPDEMVPGPVHPDWGQSPIQVCRSVCLFSRWEGNELTRAVGAME